MKPIAISIDPAEVTKKHYGSAFSYTFLGDPKGNVIRRYDLLHEKSGMGGGPTARPAEFLIDRNGVVRWRNLTEDYRVRARADEMLREAKALSAK